MLRITAVPRVDFKNRIVLGGALCAVLASCAVSAALADSLFVRDRNISVLERPRPEYQAPGIRAGQFIVRPKVDIGAGYNSNVFALSNVDAALGYDSFEEESDVFGYVRPSVRVESDWNRHALAFGGYVEATRFNRYDSESIVDGGVYVDGQYDISSRAAIFGGGSLDEISESRRSYNTAFLFDEPITYTLAEGYVGFQNEAGRFRYLGRLDVDQYDYQDVELAMPAGTGGVTVPTDQDFRDRTATELKGEIGFALTPDTALFLTGIYNMQDFQPSDEIMAPERDSDGYRVTLGAEFDLTKLIRGRLDVGYFEQTYDDPSYSSIDGVAIDAEAQWFPTELTTVSLTGSRGVAQSAIVSAGGLIETKATLRADHELLRNLILSGFVAYGHDDYQDAIIGTPPNGVKQTANKWGGGLGAKYYMNRHVSAGVDYTYETQDVKRDVFSGGFDTDYDIHQVLFTITLER